MKGGTANHDNMSTQNCHWCFIFNTAIWLLLSILDFSVSPGGRRWLPLQMRRLQLQRTWHLTFTLSSVWTPCSEFVPLSRPDSLCIVLWWAEGPCSLS